MPGEPIELDGPQITQSPSILQPAQCDTAFTTVNSTTAKRGCITSTCPTLATPPGGDHIGDTLTGLAVPEGRDVALTAFAAQNGLRFFT